MTYTQLRALFIDPPEEYAPVDCWWWEAGALNEDRMRTQLEEYKEQGIGGTFYYPRFLLGEEHGSDPPYWSDQWWHFMNYSMAEHRKLGLRAWLSDWSWFQFTQDQMRADSLQKPELLGHSLSIHQKTVDYRSTAADTAIAIPNSSKLIVAGAYEISDSTGTVDPSSWRDLSDMTVKDTLHWHPSEGQWWVYVVFIEPYDLDFLSPAVGEQWIDLLLGEYERRLGSHIGEVFEAYGTDELPVLTGRIPFTDGMFDEFRDTKGYDPTPYLAGLFRDIGDMTPKIRCDFYDVIVNLLDSNLYRPFADWLHERGMQYVEFCPLGKWMDILAQTYHYGDFFRYMSHYDIPGNEEARAGNTRTFQAKLVSSIAHVYGKPRVGVCAYWGTGWGQSLEQGLHWTNENYAYGVNLYNGHGGQYHTMGGWYEWVPPSIHMRQPYWRHWHHFAEYVRRLSMVMSQGHHVADVALLYPITTIHAHWIAGSSFETTADQSANTAFLQARHLFDEGIDLDFVDDRSLVEAEVVGGKLRIGSLEFSSLLLPALSTIRRDSMEKACEFFRSGGTVVAFGCLPSGSPEYGRNDPFIGDLISEVFGLRDAALWVQQYESEGERRSFNRGVKNAGQGGGFGLFLPSHAFGNAATVADMIRGVIECDVIANTDQIWHTHQRSDDMDIYFFCSHAPFSRTYRLSLRTDGAPEIWDAATGEVSPLYHHQRDAGRTIIHLDLEPGNAAIVVVRRGRQASRVVADNLETTAIRETADAIRIEGWSDVGGRVTAQIEHNNRSLRTSRLVAKPPHSICLDGPWQTRLLPTMDNRWGDFRYPASRSIIGAEACKFRYRIEESADIGIGHDEPWHYDNFDDGDWNEQVYSYGPYWWTCGPFIPGDEPTALIENAKRGCVDRTSWKLYNFSQKFGCDDPDVHDPLGEGLRGVADDFIVFDALKCDGSENCDAVRYLTTSIYSKDERVLTFDFSGSSIFPRQAWINGALVVSISSESEMHSVTKPEYPRNKVTCDELKSPARSEITLRPGWNDIVLSFVQEHGKKLTTYAAFYDSVEAPQPRRFVPLLRWFQQPTELYFDPFRSDDPIVSWYRFDGPPGLSAFTVPIAEGVRILGVWVNNRELEVRKNEVLIPESMLGMSQITLKMENSRGHYGGAAFDQPVRFKCDVGEMCVGDWSSHALSCYSGEIVYSRTVLLELEHLQQRIMLDLGMVEVAAEVIVNGRTCGVRYARPYRYDISALAVNGMNTIEVKVANTLANFYSEAFPTKHVLAGQTVSGLIGPVKICFATPIRMTTSENSQ